MKHLTELFQTVAEKVEPPVLVAMGSPWQATQLVMALPGMQVECFQMDLFQAERLRDKLKENEQEATVHLGPDLWDLPAKYRTVLFPSSSHADRELKIDLIDQGFHVLEEGGKFITLSEYEKDVQTARWHKNVFGKCSETPRSKQGMAFWSSRQGERPRRRHEIVFHARIGDGESMSFASWPGTFSYGRMDNGSRAMLEVTEAHPGERILDMGCGNGSVGCLAAPWTEPDGEVIFADSHTRAIALSEKNAQANGLKKYQTVLGTNMAELGQNQFDVILANPPYYANSEVAQMFISSSRDLLTPNGRFYLVTKMPVQTIPEVVETFGEVESVENRGYTVIIGRC